MNRNNLPLYGRKHTRLYALIAACLVMMVYSNRVSAQVTIGDEAAPRKGAVLDLKVTNNGAYIGGLLLPNVTILDLGYIPASYTDAGEMEGYDANKGVDTNIDLAGMIVYNPTGANNIEAGVYLWDGENWRLISSGSSMSIQDPGPFDKDGETKEIEIVNPGCSFAGNYVYTLIIGSDYASIHPPSSTDGKFSVTFSANDSALPRNAVVMVTDPCGKTATFVFTQEANTDLCELGAPSPTINSQNGGIICSGGAEYLWLTGVTTGATPSVEYIWTKNNVELARGISYTATSAGTYVVYTGAIGCPDGQASITLTSSDNTAENAVTITATNGGILCTNGNVILTANTSLSVQWFHNGVPAGTTNPLSVSGADKAGIWFAAVTGGSCASKPSNPLTLIDNTTGSTALPVPVATVNGQELTGSGIVICKNGTLRLEVTNAGDYPGGTVFEWFNNGVSIGKSASPIMYLVAPNTDNMTLWVTASNQSGNCPNTAVSKTIEVNLTAPGITNINNGALQAAICGGTSATLIVGHAGAESYEWLKDGETFAVQADQTLSVSVPGNYTVRYKESDGCWSQVSTNISVIQSAPVEMTWNIVPTDVTKGSSHTYSVNTSPAATQYEWSYNSPNGAIVSLIKIGNGSSAVVTYGDQTTNNGVTITVKTVGHPCGDATLSKTISVKDECTKGTSVNLTPNGTISLTENTAQTFSASTNASNNEGDLKYEWFVNEISQGAGASPQNTFTYTPTKAGTYTVLVRVTNSCTTVGDNVTAQATIDAQVDVNKYTPDDTGNFRLTGKICYDVAQSNWGGDCGEQSQRHGDFLDANRNWDEGKKWVYTFIASSGYTDLQFVTDDPSVLIKTETSDINGKTHTLIFDESVLTKAKGKDRANALTITVYALYEAGEQKRRVELKIRVQDCICCGAKTSSGAWLDFMCHNLGADTNLDPFTYVAGNADGSGGTLGYFFQWGRPADGHEKRNSKTTTTLAPSNTPNHNLFITHHLGDWRSGGGQTSRWGDGSVNENQPKGANDPCPPGWKVPSQKQWQSVHTSNTWTRSGNGYKVGSALFLPLAGFRHASDGRLYLVGTEARYWSSTVSSANSYNLFLGSSVNPSNAVNRAYAFSVRCVSE